MLAITIFLFSIISVCPFTTYVVHGLQTENSLASPAKRRSISHFLDQIIQNLLLARKNSRKFHLTQEQLFHKNKQYCAEQIPVQQKNLISLQSVVGRDWEAGKKELEREKNRLEGEKKSVNVNREEIEKEKKAVEERCRSEEGKRGGELEKKQKGFGKLVEAMEVQSGVG